VEYGGHRYALTREFGTWEECEAEAQAVGGHLATINDDAENRFLTEAFSDTFTKGHPGSAWASLAWIGFESVDGEWRWASGEPVTFDPPWWNSPSEGTHAYLHPASHPAPATWWNFPGHDDPEDDAAQPRGIIEVIPAAPTGLVADAGGPYPIQVGDVLALDASGSTPGEDEITSYIWDLDDDGVFETDVGGWEVFLAPYSYLESLGIGPGGPYDIHLRVTDSGELSSTDDATLLITTIPGDVSLDGTVDILDLNQ
jgi:hypothetical protein